MRQHAGTYAEAMRQQQAARDAAELEALIRAQTWEMRRDGAQVIETYGPENVVLTPRHPVQEPESAYVSVGERVDWVSEARDVRASVEWAPSMVRLMTPGDEPVTGNARPRVRRALKIESIERLAADLAATEASLKGLKGKSRILRKAKIARMTAALEHLTREPDDDEPAWMPDTLEPAPVVVRATTQADYYGFDGAPRGYRPTPSIVEVSRFTAEDWRRRMPDVRVNAYDLLDK